MAGRPRTKAQIEELKDRVDELEIERDRYKALLAAHAPHAIIDQLPEPLGEYSEDIIPKVIALGALGYTEAEMIAEIGAQPDDWERWKGTYRPFLESLSRARAMAKAHFDRQVRDAMARKDWRFPFQNVRNVLELRFQTENTDGDAAKYVQIDWDADAEAAEPLVR